MSTTFRSKAPFASTLPGYYYYNPATTLKSKNTSLVKCGSMLVVLIHYLSQVLIK